MCDLPGRCGQGDFYGVGVAAKIVAGFKEREVCMALECVCRSQTCNARANDRNARAVCIGVPIHRRPPEYKNVAKRPGANEGGREEEENRPGVATGPESGRLRNNETVSASAALVCAADAVMTLRISA